MPRLNVYGEGQQLPLHLVAIGQIEAELQHRPLLSHGRRRENPDGHPRRLPAEGDGERGGAVGRAVVHNRLTGSLRERQEAVQQPLIARVHCYPQQWYLAYGKTMHVLMMFYVLGVYA